MDNPTASQPNLQQAASSTPPVLTRQQVRAVDARAIEYYGMLGVVLMENAGRGAAECIDHLVRERFPGDATGVVSILCGKGNNAGDGYVIARHLQLLGHRVAIIQCSPAEELNGDALHHWRIAQSGAIPTYCLHPVQAQGNSGGNRYVEQLTNWLSNSCVIVDCLLGTGATGMLRSPFAEAVELANRIDALRIAIDVPTGLDCDTGAADRYCFHADHTCTFVAAKPGFMNPQAKEYIGQLHVLGIGVPKKLLAEFSLG
jgi:NAD(P)H-hydrate epimerase